MFKQQPREIDELEIRLLKAAGRRPIIEEKRSRNENLDFFVGLGCGARVQISHIDGKPVGSVALHLRRLSPETAEAVLNFLRTRNEPNSMYDK